MTSQHGRQPEETISTAAIQGEASDEQCMGARCSCVLLSFLLWAPLFGRCQICALSTGESQYDGLLVLACETVGHDSNNGIIHM